MKKALLFAWLLLSSIAGHAQSYPQNVLPGYMSTTCPAGVTAPCWVPNSSTNPIPVVLSSGGGSSTSAVSGPAVNGTSLDNVSVSTTAGTIVPAATFTGWATIENASTGGQTIYVSFGTASANSFAIAPGAALTLQFGPKNALSGIASAAGAKASVIGY